jgi:hypothetical protein
LPVGFTAQSDGNFYDSFINLLDVRTLIKNKKNVLESPKKSTFMNSKVWWQIEINDSTTDQIYLPASTNYQEYVILQKTRLLQTHDKSERQLCQLECTN